MKLSLISAAALGLLAMAVPASAQPVISNPGYCAQFYPNANCQNLGPGNPYTGSYQSRRGWHDSRAQAGSRVYRKHGRHHRHIR